MDVQKITGKFTGKAAGSVLLTLAAALALWLFIAAQIRRTATAEISRSLITINSYKAAQIKAWREDRGREALRLSRHPILGGIVAEELSKPGSRRALLNAWLKNDSAQKQYASMAFLSPKGAVIAATPGYPAGTETNLRKLLAPAFLKGTPQLTDLYLAADGRPRMTMISPISAGAAPGGKTLCLLVINIDPATDFYPLVKAAPLLFAAAETTLVRREGENVLFLTDLDYSRGSALKLTRPLSDTRLPAAKAIKEGYSGFYEGVDYRGRKVFSAMNRTGGTDWMVITKVDRDATLAPVRTRERLALALLLLAAGLVYLAVYSMLRRWRAAAAATLEESRHLLAETEEIGKVGGWDYKIDAKELLCTEEVRRIHELDPAYKFDLSKDTSFYTPASRPLIERAMRRAIERGEGFDLELEIITAKGNNRAVHVIARPDLPNRRIYGFFQDITERKLAEEQIRENEARYRALIDASGDGILTADLETRKFRFANRAICRMLGYTAEELTALSVTDIHPREALPAVIAEFEAQASGKKILATDLPCLRKDGSVFYADISTTPVTVDGRRCNLGIFRDITERRKAEEALRASEAHLRAALESTADGILSVDNAGKVLQANRRFAALWKIPQPLLERGDDRALQDFVLEQLSEPAAFLAKVRELYDSDTESMDTLAFKDGRFFERFSLPMTMGGVRIGRVWSFRDITGRRQAEEKLRESEERMRVTLEETQIGTWDWDVSRDTWQASPTYFTMLGYPPERGNSDRNAWLPRVHPADRELVAEKIRGVLNGGADKYRYEARIKHADGTYKWVAVLGSTVKAAEDGRPARVMGVRMDITERKLAEEALKKSEERYRETVELAVDGILLGSPKGEITGANSQMQKLAGRTLAQLVGLHISALFPPEVLRSAPLRFDLLNTGRTVINERDLLRPDGTTVPIEMHSKLMPDGTYQSIYRDRTEDRRAGKERLSHLRFLESMDRVNRAIQGANDLETMMANVLTEALAIFDCDRAWLFYPCDPEAPSFQVPMEVTRPEYPGAKILNTDIPMPPDMARNLREALEAPEPVTYTLGTEKDVNKVSAEQFGVKSQMMTALYPKLGKPWAFGLHQCSYPRAWSPEETRLLQEIGRRLTDALSSLLSYREVRESEQNLKEAQRLAGLGNWTMDLAGNKFSWSDEVHRIFETDPGGFVPSYEAFLDAIHPEDREYVDKAYTDSVKNRSRYDIMHRLRMKDGRIKYVRECCETFYARDGRPLASRGMILDLTGMKLAELKLEKLNRDLVAKRQEMENFLYITSHDLRTPLVNIQGFAQNLEKYLRELVEELSPAQLPREVKESVSKLTGKEIPGALNFVLKSSHKMDSLINSLLKVSRLGRVEMKPRNLEMNDFLKKIVDSTFYQLEKAGAEIKVGVLPPCNADPEAVSQIFSNLLENAIKYRAEGRVLSVSVTGEPSGDRVLYKVADNGSGIAARDLGRIWDIFYRGAGAGEGEGIGLTVVKYMTEKNGGSIKAESEEGRGTVFYLELPAAGE